MFSSELFKTQSSIVIYEPVYRYIAPPLSVALLFLNVEFTIALLLPDILHAPPFLAELFINVKLYPNMFDEVDANNSAPESPVAVLL